MLFREDEIPPGIIIDEDRSHNPEVHKPAPHANSFSISHNDTDVYLWFGEGNPPMISSDAEKIPDDLSIKANTVAYVSMPVVFLYYLGALCDEQISVYKSRFGEPPYIPEWRLRPWKRKTEERKVEVLREWGWLPSHEEKVVAATHADAITRALARSKERNKAYLEEEERKMVNERLDMEASLDDSAPGWEWYRKEVEEDEPIEFLNDKEWNDLKNWEKEN